jgi:hypothetical protein
MSQIEMKMRQRIILKIAIAGGISRRSAVSISEADLDPQEQYWLPYLIGGYSNYKIKKTEGNRYFQQNIHPITN